MPLRLSLRFASAALAASLAAAGCSGSEAVQSTPPAGGRGGGAGGPGGGSGAAVPVATALVAEKAMPLELTVIGSVEAYSTVAVRAQITGSLNTVSFREGDDVQKGQLLFALDRRPLEAALEQAKANLQRDTAQAANARSQAQRYQDLSERGIATREQLDTARTAATALEATLEADKAAVENAEVQLQYATINSPISGRTGALQVHEGNLVRANDATPLVVINQVTPIFVSFGIPEARLPELKQYMARGSVKVEALAPNDTGAPSVGRITFVDNAVDPATGTIRIKGTFANDSRHLWPGQFVNVTVTLMTDPRAVVVPTVAVQTGQQGQYVFVVKPDKTVELRNVSVLRAVDAESIIKQGLKAGETVVTDGHLRLTAGSRVSIKSGPGSQVAP
jgi:multidrug efflux system membrane fusion protein